MLQLQCAKTDERGRIHVIETSTRLVDIPYGDYFSVEDRWTLVPRDTTPPSCTLCIELKVRHNVSRCAETPLRRVCSLLVCDDGASQVEFSKSTFWKGKIEARAIADNKTKWREWVERAKQHLVDKRAAAHDVVSVTPPSSNEQQQQPVESSEHARRPSQQLTAQSSSTSSRTPKRRSSRATSGHRASRGSAQSAGAARGPSTSFILYLRGALRVSQSLAAVALTPSPVYLSTRAVLPWILVLGLFFLVVRMQSSLATIEQTLVATSAQMSAIERQLASLTAACPAVAVGV